MSLTSIIPTGLNWYKWGAIALLAIGLVVGGYYKGKHDCEMDHQTQKTEQAEERTRVIVQHVKDRVPVIQKDEAEAAQLRAELSQLKGKLYEAINARPDLPECALSDDELRYFQEAARRTH